jgi:2-polyprenyl-3-methyl-5-hydroxy-6-metoxy-1,4-benzoquinol methylase
MNPFEKEAYNLTYLSSNEYKSHYTQTTFFTMWKCVMGKLSKENKLLDLGCGPGHLANMLYDNGFENYVGIDFSNVAIYMARVKVPTYTFIEANLSDVDFNNYSDFNFISTEVFEHLENDIELIKRLPKNRIVFSVPNYLCIDHYRVYDDEDFIKKYYRDVLDISYITAIPVKAKGKMFVVEANIK